MIVDVAADHSSFHINATLVRVDSSTTYTGGTASDLVAGVKVEVEGVIATDDALQAKKVKFDAESHGADSRIEAAISAIDSAAKTFTVLGAVIHVADSTVFRDSRDGNHTFAFSSLVVGDFVSAGFSSKAGTLTASRVDRSKPRSASTLKAGVESFDATAQTLKIAGVAVNASGASYAVNDNPVTAKQFYDQLRAGSIVRVKGSFSGSLFTATEAELEVDK